MDFPSRLTLTVTTSENTSRASPVWHTILQARRSGVRRRAQVQKPPRPSRAGHSPRLFAQHPGCRWRLAGARGCSQPGCRPAPRLVHRAPGPPSGDEEPAGEGEGPSVSYPTPHHPLPSFSHTHASETTYLCGSGAQGTLPILTAPRMSLKRRPRFLPRMVSRVPPSSGPRSGSICWHQGRGWRRTTRSFLLQPLSCPCAHVRVPPGLSQGQTRCSCHSCPAACLAPGSLHGSFVNEGSHCGLALVPGLGQGLLQLQAHLG